MAIPPIPSHLQLQIVSADRLLVNEQVDEVRDPGRGGLPRRPARPHAAAGDAAGGRALVSPGTRKKHYLLDRVRVRRSAARSRDDPGADCGAGARNRRGRGPKPRRSAPKSGSRSRRRTWTSSGRGSRCSRRSSGCRSRVALESARRLLLPILCQTSICSIPRPDLEPRGARPQGALSRLGPRLLLVLRQPAAAAADLLVRVHDDHAEQDAGRAAVRAVHVLRHPALELVLRRRCRKPPAR